MDLSANFEELMQRSPISHHDMKNFLREMRRTPSGTVTVSKLLAGKIQGSSEAQSIHAFEFLEAALESETEGSIEFRTEIGRYRFLNEIIRILSPKYLGESTPEAVKERAVKFLEDAAGAKRKRWFPSEHSKVNSVYQSLIDGGIIPKPNKVADEDAEFQKSIFERGENAVILKRLLQSKDPSDLQAANRLIKNLVDEEARRNERRAELHSLIDRIETSVGLLTEMLSQPNIDKEIVEELVDTCRNLRQKLGGVATETNDEVTSLLQASENIEKVLTLYESKKEWLNNPPSETAMEESANPGSSAGACSSSVAELSLADQLLMNLVDSSIICPTQVGASATTVPKQNGIEDGNLLLNLDVDLGQGPLPKSNGDTKPEPVEPLFEISKISREMMEQGLKGIPNSTQSKKTDKTPLNQLKRPSQDSPLSNSPGFPSFPVPQSVLPSTSSQSQPQPPVSESLSLLDLDFLEKPRSSSVTATITSADPLPSSTNLNSSKPDSRKNNKSQKPKLSSSEEENNLLLALEKEKVKSGSGESNSHQNGTNNNNQNGKINNKNDQKEKENIDNAQKTKRKSTSDFSLNTVRDLDLENIDLFEDLKPLELSLEEESCKDVSLTLTFGKYPGLPSSVNVAVVTFSNRSKNNGLLNYVFQLIPPKGLQVKLLPPACMELPPWKKIFLPPPVLTQVALIVIPKSNAVSPKIKFILSYCVEDETVLHNGEFLLPSSLLQ